MEPLIIVRNGIEKGFYRYILKPQFFRRDPEAVHDAISAFSEWAGRYAVSRGLTRLAFDYHHPMLEQRVAGIDFRNPVGLSAGFDKNARLIDFMAAVGFGFVEVGSITGEACEGNPKPRLWRMPESQSLLVYYGLMNDGAEAISTRLKQRLGREGSGNGAGGAFPIPVGVNIAKTNNKATVDVGVGMADYVKAYRAFAGIGTYYTINISCPNTFGGEPFADPDRLELLLAAIDKEPHDKPVFVKFSPDLDHALIDELLEVIAKHKVDGLICGNLTKHRQSQYVKDAGLPDVGGIGGKAQRPYSDAQLQYVAERTRGKYVLVGTGGIFSAEDAYRKIRAGASLVQLITGMIYEGPTLISEIKLGLVELLRRDGFKNIAEAVGADLK